MRTKSSRKKPSDDEMIETASSPSELRGEAELHALIAARAYEIYRMRGDAPGDDLGNWLAAEREILSSLSAPFAAVDNVVPLESAKEKRSRTTKLSAVGKSGKQTTGTTRSRKPKENT